MNNLEFYDIVDSEIDAILEKYSNDEVVKNINNLNSRKSYGFLLWFLENNLKNEITKIDKLRPYIVDGDDDNSCDLIFTNNILIFYESGQLIFNFFNCSTFNGRFINNKHLIICLIQKQIT